MISRTREETPSLRGMLDRASDRLGIKEISGGAGPGRPLSRLRITRLNNRIDLSCFPLPETIGIFPLHASPSGKGVPIFPPSWSRSFSSGRSSTWACIALAGTGRIPESLIQAVGPSETLLFASAYDEFLLESRLTGLFREHTGKETSLSGGLVSFDGRGMLILGESGLGKTTCALELVKRGYRWIADDVVVARKRSGGRIYGSNWNPEFPLLEIKGRGIVRAEQVLDRSAILAESRIDCFVELVEEEGMGQGTERGHPLRTLDILETPVYGRSLPVTGDAVGMASKVDTSIRAMTGMGRNH
ncbi:MAG: HPr kinase/phosphorylase [Syntrophus sp. PtaU1.Bin005]|mgnify:CR=1 FL=1|nr:MAG: HPr kinase/phosphorylase [Syntrophus sp. PtaB.Bin138]OPY82545.1 MAG: HPr kinase/phosphorylase [Syntrophus sp. PtaU1.Bin005]